MKRYVLMVLSMIMVSSLSCSLFTVGRRTEASQSSADEASDTVVGGEQTDSGDPSILPLTTDGFEDTTPTDEILPPESVDTRVSEFDGMVQVYVPEGAFLMGALESDSYAGSDEFPQHEVYLDAFWIDETEVTNAMFAVFLSEKMAEHSSMTRPDWLDYDSYSHIDQVRTGTWRWEVEEGFEDYPATGVSWFAAEDYCQWAGRRLPTEAEWEKAARGTDGRIYPWGTGTDCLFANRIGCDYPDTVPVRSFPAGASPYGAYEMAGNAAEWVADWYDAEYYEISPMENPSGPGSGEERVMRGGSYLKYVSDLRTTHRIGSNPVHYGGFRCASSP